MAGAEHVERRGYSSQNGASVALGLLADHVCNCVTGIAGETQAAQMDELVAAVGRLVKT